MKTDKPILMSAPMVLATLEGRKKQTRRIMNPQPKTDHGAFLWEKPGYAFATNDISQISKDSFLLNNCPYGIKGGLLWIRESMKADHETSDTCTLGRYSADNAPVLYLGAATDENGEDDYGGSHAHWEYSRQSCPSIHMPRKFSRITLEITEVRVQRLQDISEEDALSEGIVEYSPGRFAHYGALIKNQAGVLMADLEFVDGEAKGAFALLWRSINGAGSWQQNPWVWCISYEPHFINIDDFLKAKAA